MEVDYVIYTDGSCRGNGQDSTVGGWAYVILRGEEIVLSGSGGERNTTNQRMELTAALEACRALCQVDGAFKAKLYSDSAYLINCRLQHWYKNWLKNNWMNSKRQPVANRDLWLGLIEYFDSPKEEFIFEKVKGHSGVTYNEMVDKMAVRAAEEARNGSSDNSSL